MAEWQTRRTQNPLSERACGFESHLGHYWSIRNKQRARASSTRRVLPRRVGTVGGVLTHRESEPGPLADIRVLDLTQALAGPFCTMLLADLGADVIKVEPPAGDMTRFAGPYTTEDTERAYGGYFASIDRGKRSIVLDLKNEADLGHRSAARGERRRRRREQPRAGVMDRLGLGYETLAAFNPELVYGTAVAVR